MERLYLIINKRKRKIIGVSKNYIKNSLLVYVNTVNVELIIDFRDIHEREICFKAIEGKTIKTRHKISRVLSNRLLYEMGLARPLNGELIACSNRLKIKFKR